MRKAVWIQAVLFLLSSAVPAFCQSGSADDEITQEEYGIYRLVLKKQREWSSVDRETLAGVRADFDDPIRPAGMKPPPDLRKDFNEKNIKVHRLSDAFLQETAQGSGGNREGRKKITFSRVGFDGEKRRALIIIGIAWYYPEDVMNEGEYVFLEKRGGEWTVVDTTRAWAVRLGPVR